jgi:hypothetical protein
MIIYDLGYELKDKSKISYLLKMEIPYNDLLYLINF